MVSVINLKYLALAGHTLKSSLSRTYVRTHTRQVAALEDTGSVADYIPQLAKVDPTKFAVAVTTIDGQRFSFGDADESVRQVNCVLTREDAGLGAPTPLMPWVGSTPPMSPRGRTLLTLWDLC